MVNYTYFGVIKEWTGVTQVQCLVDLGFARHQYVIFDLADVTPIYPEKVLSFVKEWTARGTRVRIESIRGDERYEAYLWRGAECLNLELRDADLALG